MEEAMSIQFKMTPSSPILDAQKYESSTPDSLRLTENDPETSMSHSRTVQMRLQLRLHVINHMPEQVRLPQIPPKALTLPYLPAQT